MKLPKKADWPQVVHLWNEHQVPEGVMENHAWKAFPFPIKECLFLRHDSPGFSFKTSGTPLIHRPTQDLWSLDAEESGGLSLSRIILYKTAPQHAKDSIIIAMRHLNIEPTL